VQSQSQSQSQHACIHSNNTTPFAPSICSLVRSLFQTQTRLIPLKVQLFESFLLPLFASPLCFTSLHTHASHFMLHFTTSLRITTQHITSILSHHHPGLEREADQIISYHISNMANSISISYNTTTTTTTLNNNDNDNSELQRQLCRTGKEKRKKKNEYKHQ